MENYLVLIFLRNNGAKHSVKFPFPSDTVDGAKVKSLGEYMVTHQVFALGEGASLTSFSGAYVQSISSTPVSIA